MLGIIGALTIEVQGLLDLMDEKEAYTLGAYSMTKGKLHGRDLVVCKCGIGKVNSSTATMLMIRQFGVDSVINIGVAGGYRTLKQCDTVIGSYTVQHDYDATADGQPLGQVDGFESPFVPCDEQLARTLKGIADEKGYPNKLGVIASGDCFVASNEKSEAITKAFGALAYDMESGAINHVCSLLGVKFAAIRSISDNGNDGAIDSFYTFATKAAAVALDMVSTYVQSL